KKFPALELRAIGKIGVFRQRVVLPAAGGINRGAAPDTRGSVEVKKGSPARTPAMLNHEMPVEQNRFHSRQQGVVAVEICPAGLHHPDLALRPGIQKIGNRAAKEIRLRNEI